MSFLFAPYCFAAQQASAEGRRNNVSLHFVSLPLVALGTNPCLRQSAACLKVANKRTPQNGVFLFAPYCFAAQQATAEGRRNNVSLHFVSLPLVALGTNPCLRQLRVAPTSRQRKRRENNSPFFSLSSSRTTLHRLRQREDEITYRYTSFRSPPLVALGTNPCLRQSAACNKVENKSYKR